MKTPKPPADLSAAAKKMWTELYESSDMDAAAVLVLDTMARAYDRMLQARELIRQNGAILAEQTAKGNVHSRPNPAIKIEKDSAEVMLRCWRLMGYDIAAAPEV